MNKLKLSLALMALIVGLGGAFFVQSNVVEAHTRTVKIRVDKNGFSPASIEAEAGHKLNLVFTRADKDNCGGTVVLPTGSFFLMFCFEKTTSLPQLSASAR